MNLRLVGTRGILAFSVACRVAFGVPAVVRAQQTVAAESHSSTLDTKTIRALLDRPVTVSLDHVTLAQAIDAIAASAGVGVLYHNETVNAMKKVVTLRVTRLSLGRTLERVLDHTSLMAIPISATKVGIISATNDGVQDGGTITGQVVDAKSKQPLRNVMVTLDENTRGVATDEEGKFRMTNVKPGSHLVRARLIGYAKQGKEVSVVNDDVVTVSFGLESRANALSEVVVTGTVIPTERKAVPNAITVITGKELEQRGITHIDQLFHGDVPGLFAQAQGSSQEFPGYVSMASRGSTNLPGTNTARDPLYLNGPPGSALAQPIKTYVDGVELADPSYLGLIDPKSIERIEILTGPQASTIYGSNAINGVMQIFTKRGTTAKPQFTFDGRSGLIQNNFSTALTSQHDYSGQVSSVEGHLSYNAGATWQAMGPWSPAVHTRTANGFGGVHLQQSGFSADLSVRRTAAKNLIGGFGGPRIALMTEGLIRWAPAGIPFTHTTTANNQTLGLSATYAPVHWWSQTVTVGTDQMDAGTYRYKPFYQTFYDTLGAVQQSTTTRTSLAYSTTLNTPLTAWSNINVTAGADGWHSLISSAYIESESVFNGLLSDPCIAQGYSCTRLARTPGHDHGAFVQGQLGMWDALFVTYGLRAEWNPDYGPDANPNLVPRYGIAYTRELGPITAKLRGSYGHSTRPPIPTEAQACYYGDPMCNYSYYLTSFGRVESQRANPNLLPEQQQGGEGGLELYLGNRASLVVTRYNQTVDNLITSAVVDSVDMLPEQRVLQGCAPWQCHAGIPEYLNLGSVRNQGWELNGTAHLGPLTTTGTYSWTKSRIIGITPKYARQFQGQYVVGAPFQYLPEHTYALGLQYVTVHSTIGLNVHGQGLLYNYSDDIRDAITLARLRISAPRMSDPRPTTIGPGYALADLNASRRLSGRVEGTLQVQNVTDSYHNDFGTNTASIGRQSMLGLRVRW